MNTESLVQQKRHNNRRVKKSKLIKGKVWFGKSYSEMKGFFENKGEMLYMPDCKTSTTIYLKNLISSRLFVNLNGIKARTRNLILQWDKFFYISVWQRE